MEEATFENQDIDTSNNPEVTMIPSNLVNGSFYPMSYMVNNSELAEFVFEKTPFERYVELLSSKHGWNLLIISSLRYDKHEQVSYTLGNSNEYLETFFRLLLNSDNMTKELFDKRDDQSRTCLHNVSEFCPILLPLFLNSEHMTKELFDAKDNMDRTFLDSLILSYKFRYRSNSSNLNPVLDMILKSDFLTEETLCNINGWGSTIFGTFSTFDKSPELMEYARQFLSRCDKDHLLSIVTKQDEIEFIQSL